MSKTRMGAEARNSTVPNLKAWYLVQWLVFADGWIHTYAELIPDLNET